jgi:biotin transporter BioY
MLFRFPICNEEIDLATLQMERGPDGGFLLSFLSPLFVISVIDPLLRHRRAALARESRPLGDRIVCTFT